MLKYAAKVVADPLTKLFNMSIGTGPFGCKELPPNHNARYSGQGVFEQFLSRQVYNQFDNVLDPGISAYR